jgi:type IV pilus assembly protein PilM
VSTLHRKGRALLGIDINATEIRLVEVQGPWPNPEIIRADRIPTPQGAIQGDEIVRPDLVGKSLSALLATMGTHTRAAVIGVPSNRVSTRVLDIPHVPEEEILSVVKGEILHQRILPTADGEFDYLSLQTGDLRRQARPRLLLMAAESRYLVGAAAAAELADLRLVALEPGLPAMYRAATPTSYSRSPSLCLMIGSTVSEVAIMDQGPIRLYRRIDIGASQFLGDLSNLSEVDTSGVEDQILEEEARTEQQKPKPRSLTDDPDESAAAEVLAAQTRPRPAMDASDATPARILLVELQRSMDYYHREYPEAPSVNSIVVACGSHELSPFIAWLSDALHIATVPAQLTTVAQIDDAGLRSMLDGPDGFRYLRAAGLAMRGLDQLPSEIPAFDLMRHDPDEAKKPRARNYLSIALAASIVLMLASTVNVMHKVHVSQEAEARLQSALGEAAGLSSYRGIAVKDLKLQHGIRDAIHPSPTTVTQLTDAVAAAIPPECAVADLSIDTQGNVNLQGSADADMALVQMLEALRKQPEFTRVSLDHLDRTSSQTDSGCLTYQISMKTK